MTTGHYLYKITNMLSNKSYIGVTQDTTVRWKDHCRSTGSCISSAINKYGVGNFSFQVLVVGPKDYIYELEEKAICIYGTRVPNGYNIAVGGVHPFYGGLDSYTAVLDGGLARVILTSKDTSGRLSKDIGVSASTIDKFRRGKTYLDLYRTLSEELNYDPVQAKAQRVRYLQPAKGTASVCSKLTAQDIENILTTPVPATVLAHELGVGTSTVIRVRTGQIYKELFNVLSEKLNYSYEKLKKDIRGGKVNGSSC